MNTGLSRRLSGYHGACLDAARRGRYPTAWRCLRAAGTCLRTVPAAQRDDEFARWRDRFMAVWQDTGSWAPEPDATDTTRQLELRGEE